MKKFLLAGVGVLALGIAHASAADVRPPPAKAPPYVAPPFTWTGFYVGINGGYGWGTSDFSTPFANSFDISGGLIGGTLGYNYQVNQFVFGIEGDIDASWIEGSAACGGLSCETSNSWLATIRGRLGYAFDRFLPYVTGGAAFGDVETSIAGFGSNRDTNVGWTIGGGLEYAINGPWSVKVEYLYVDLGDGGTIPGTGGAEADFTTNIVRAGLNYRF